GDLAGDEVLAAALRLVVEQNAINSEHAVGVAVLLNNPEAVLLGYSVGAVGMEGSGLALGDLLDFAEQLRGGSLVDAGLLGQAQNPDGLQDTQDAQSVHVAGVLGSVEGNLHMALSGEVVDFIGLHQTDDPNQRRRIGQVA